MLNASVIIISVFILLNLFQYDKRNRNVINITIIKNNLASYLIPHRNISIYIHY